MVFETDTKHANQFLIARRKMTFSVSSGTSASEDVEINGELLNYISVATDLTTDTTYGGTITNEDSETVYANTGIADNSSVTTLLSVTGEVITCLSGL